MLSRGRARLRSAPSWPQQDTAWRPDDGFTLIEMLIALVMVGLASAAALTIFVASFGSQRDERSHSQGVRLATGALDIVRGQDMCALTMGDSSFVPDTYNGVEFTTHTNLAAVSANDLTATLTLCSTPLSVVRAKSIVTWIAQGKPASVTMSTVIADRSAHVVAGEVGVAVGVAVPPSALSISISGFSISPLTINRSTTPVGYASQDDVLTVSALGFAVTDVLMARYVDDDGQKTFALSWTSGSTWRGKLLAQSLHRVISADTTLAISVTGTGASDSGSLSLSLEAVPAVPLTVSSASVNGGQEIVLTRVQNRNNGGENTSDVALSAVVDGLDGSDPANSVKVSYPLSTGAAGEVALTWVPGTNQWRATIPARSQKIAPGAAPGSAFSYTAYRAADQRVALFAVSVVVTST
jgi:prepilin-type N-terminal cleavage/methylation domain-containing protein